MPNLNPTRGIVVLLVAALFSGPGCGSDTNDPVTPGIQPEIVNATDNFQFQVSAIQNYSGSLQYTWSNTGASAVVDHSSSVSGGTAMLTISDDSGTQVYSRDLSADGSFATTAGTAGDWTVRVICSSVSGTLNFRADKQTP